VPQFAARVLLCRARLASPLAYDPMQKRDERGRWTDGFMSDAALETVADLVSIVDEIERDPTVDPIPLHGGFSAETVMFKLPDGRKIVRKRAPEWGDPNAPKRAADAEQLGSLLANALGARSARVYRTDEQTTYIEFVSGPVLGSEADAWGGKPSTRIQDAVAEHGMRLGLVDVLIANRDRNLGNMIQNDDGSLTGIDTGDAWYGAERQPTVIEEGDEDLDFSFEQSARYELVNKVDGGYPASHFAREPDPDDYGAGLVVWKDNPLTPSDVDETRRRLEALRPDFKQLGREDWLDYSLRALDEIAPHAKGTVSIYE
jgi:hypothetical protein